MLLFSDINTTDVTTGLQDSGHTPPLEIKSGAAVPFRVYFRTQATPGGPYSTARLPNGYFVKLLFKPGPIDAGNYDGDGLASAQTTAYPADDETPYTLTVNLDTAAIRTLLLNNGNGADDKASTPVMGVVMYSPDGTNDSWIESKTFSVTLTNKLNRSQDSPAPGSPGTTPVFLDDITDYIGGASNQLDSVVTAGVGVPQLFAFVPTGEALAFYLLEADDGTAVESSPDIILPDDYGVGNHKHYTRAL